MDLTAATYLGANTVPVLDDIVAQLRSVGFDIGAPDWGRDSVVAADEAPAVDLVWMCGSLASVMLADGRLDHDIVAAPVFPGETEPVYRSVFVAREDGPRSIEDALAGTIGINEPESWSGNHGLRRHFGTQSWFVAETSTGSHLASLDAVCERRCDVAGIDSSIWNALVADGDGAVDGLRVVATTGDWPAPPFLVRRGAPATLASALVAVRPEGLVGIEPASAADYAFMRV